MTETGSYAGQVDEEYLGEVRDSISAFQVMLTNMRAGTLSPAEGASRIKDQCNALGRAAHWADEALIELTLSRLEHYLEAVSAPTDHQMGDVESFLFVVEGILDGDVDRNTDQAEFVRSLPVPRPVDLVDLEHLDIEILLVEPQNASARIFERELMSGGYRVARVRRSLDALRMAVRTRPDMVISSMVLDDLSGIDLCRALAAIERTQAIPFALLSSYRTGSPEVAGLPGSAALIHKGTDFGNDLAEALQRFGIT